ncbi:glutamine cyclotransferase [Luminiphilus syltensis NOR5-1B]|uniref:Glutamine cyclotransferase n=1 Tax=Luminiphilus syltensis NOR5-1B TaxID=565045 RepID=B8KXL3_9GAMM|nr:glutaminyl-peptide cyclotransferase [Luminiphilus syltensis]EED34914.1 glutamine cyclotransferase [Luminiphilus syltensis NOR5-1B]
MRCSAFFSAVFTLLYLLAACGAVGSEPVPRYGFEIVEKIRFDRTIFTQGLEFDGPDRLIVSSGGYGESFIRIYAFPEMDIVEERKLDDRYFAEGITVVNQRLFQLTWQSGDMLVYDAKTLTPLASGRIPTQGWGLTHDGHHVWFSDGSDRLMHFDSQTGSKLDVINVTLDGKPLNYINELEWVGPEIWANVLTSDSVFRINPNSGQVTGVIDLTGLLDPEDRLSDTNVLNGIALHPKDHSIWVTGKRWPWLFRVQLKALEIDAPGPM